MDAYPKRDDSDNQPAIASSTHVTAETYLQQDQGWVDIQKSQWWLECNDCLPGPAMIAAEFWQAYETGTRNATGHAHLLRSAAVVPGSNPGSKVSSQVHASGSLNADQYQFVSLLPFELSSDLNNDGKAGEGADSSLKSAALQSGASDDAKEKGTEYLFVNDRLSNGLWDKEDSDSSKPASATDDDDVQEIKTTCAATWGAIWFDHPIINKLAFYKAKACNAGDKLTFPFALSESNKLPEKLYVRAEEVTAQIEGELVMKLGKVDKTETWAEDKLKFTVVKELGDTKYFYAARDYILENNTRFFAHDRTYTGRSFRIISMREEASTMYPIDTYNRP